MRDVSPGDDQVRVPPRVTEVPPDDRFCDLVMTGGVASGVVYPWAIVELARSYRFRSIGGTSVGAMAAVLAAAAEYGRRVGYDESFEPLRRTPGALAEVLPDGRTRMLSLFQAGPSGQRLIRLWGRIGRGQQSTRDETSREVNPKERRPPVPPLACSTSRAIGEVLWAYAWPLLLGGIAGTLLGLMFHLAAPHVLPLALAGAVVAFVYALWSDIRDGLIGNELGLCKGGTLEDRGPEGKRPGICEWLHEGIQASAGMKPTDPPLTFRDLWCAPARPGAPHQRCDADDPRGRRAIDLQVITTNVTHGRPYRLPLADETSRLFYRANDLKHYFPEDVMTALVAASRPYLPRTSTHSDPASIAHPGDFLELPGADLPIVVAARLSLSFPLLFSAVPLWAIDYEAKHCDRDLKRCLFTDGGASSNFPIHLFDAAMPRWPTFGLWLDLRDPKRPTRIAEEDQDVWLPELHFEGWGDNWNRFDPDAAGVSHDTSAPPGASRDRPGLRYLVKFLKGIAISGVDWHDRTSFRLPHVRNRVARLRLERGQGGLHIGMSRKQILAMAHRYGTAAGKLFVARFSQPEGCVSPAWREQRWVRLVLLINGMRDRLAGLNASAEWSAHAVPMSQALVEARDKGPIRDSAHGDHLEPAAADSLAKLLAELQHLEASLLAEKPPDFRPIPVPELRLRAPL